MKVYIETYGCQMNVSDSELMYGSLVAEGYTAVESPEGADVVLVNTCAIRENAEQRVLGRLGELGMVPGALLVNRILDAGVPRDAVEAHAAALLDLGGRLPVVGAPDEAMGPRGAGPLDDFARQWRTLHRVIPDETLDDRP